MSAFDPYAVLGLERTATVDEVRAAYRRLSKERHPDAGGSDVAFAELLLGNFLSILSAAIVALSIYSIGGCFGPTASSGHPFTKSISAEINASRTRSFISSSQLSPSSGNISPVARSFASLAPHPTAHHSHDSDAPSSPLLEAFFVPFSRSQAGRNSFLTFLLWMLFWTLIWCAIFAMWWWLGWFK